MPRSAIRARSTSSASSLLAPDLVVTWPFTAPAQVERAARARHCRSSSPIPATIDGIAQDIERLGALAGTLPAAAGAGGGSSARSCARLASRYAERRRVRVFYEIWDVPLYTIGGAAPHHRRRSTCAAARTCSPR